MTGSITLSPDVWICILEELERESLPFALLVSRQWKVIVEPLLYREVVLHNWRSLQSLAFIIRSSAPHVGSRLRSFTMTRLDTTTAEYSNGTLLIDLNHILMRAPNLAALSLPPYHHPSTMDIVCQTARLKLRTLHLTITYISLLSLGVVGTFSNLRSLTLTVNDKSRLPSESPAWHLPALKSLVVAVNAHTGPPLAEFLCHCQFEGLEELQYQVAPMEIPHAVLLGELLDKSTRLEQLECNFAPLAIEAMSHIPRSVTHLILVLSEHTTIPPLPMSITKLTLNWAYELDLEFIWSALDDVLYSGVSIPAVQMHGEDGFLWFDGPHDENDWDPRTCELASRLFKYAVQFFAKEMDLLDSAGKTLHDYFKR